MSTSPGPGGGRNALSHGEKVLSRNMTGKIVGTTFVPQFHQNTTTNADGTIQVVDEEIVAAIKTIIEQLKDQLG